MLPGDLTALATFLPVAEERSFTKAAKRRGVSPSAISHVMRTLEEELGVRPDYLTEGALLRVLQDWCQPYPGFFLYYPSRRQQTASLTALISVLRM